MTSLADRCQLLDQDGRQCSQRAQGRYYVHGDPETDHGWYVVGLCRRHEAADERDIPHASFKEVADD